MERGRRAGVWQATKSGDTMYNYKGITIEWACRGLAGDEEGPDALAVEAEVLGVAARTPR